MLKALWTTTCNIFLSDYVYINILMKIMNTSTRKRLCVLHKLEDFLQVLITARHSKKRELNGSPMGQQSSACRNAEMSMNIGVNRVVKSCSESVRTENRNCKLNSTRKIVMTFPVSNGGGGWGRGALGLNRNGIASKNTS